MFCSKCGKEIADNSTFCPGCGAPQQQDAAQNPAVAPNGYQDPNSYPMQGASGAANPNLRFNAKGQMIDQAFLNSIDVLSANRMSISSLTCGIVGAVFALIALIMASRVPFAPIGMAISAFIFCIIGIICGLIKRKVTQKLMISNIGLVVSAIGFILAIVAIAVYNSDSSTVSRVYRSLF